MQDTLKKWTITRQRNSKTRSIGKANWRACRTWSRDQDELRKDEISGGGDAHTELINVEDHSFVQPAVVQDDST